MPMDWEGVAFGQVLVIIVDYCETQSSLALMLETHQ